MRVNLLPQFFWFDKITEMAQKFGRFNYPELSSLRKIKSNQSRIKKKTLFRFK